MLPIIVGTSCAVAVAECQDTVAGTLFPDWIWIPVVVVVGIVILVVVGGLSRRGR
jgi:hypothetical protein